MINRYIIFLGLFSCTLSLGCMKKTKVDISNIEISTQADIDFYCDNLSDNETFEGDIIIITTEELDYKCLSAIKHVKGDLFLNGPGASKAFQELESIIGPEVFSICDEIVDTIYFPKLKIIDTGQGISIASNCNFSNVLFLPNVESLGSLTISSPLLDEERTGTILGFNKIQEMFTLRFDNGNKEGNFRIDGFENLKKVQSTFKINTINKSFSASESSFNNLEEISNFEINNSINFESDYSLEYYFPKLKASNNMKLINFDPSEVCYLKDRIESNTINVNILNTLTNEIFINENIIELCN